MAQIYESLPLVGQLQMALRVMTPTRLAQTFASFVGQFPERSAFDTLARQVSQLYNEESVEHGHQFRSQLDRRLCDRYHSPVVWEVDLPVQDRVA